MNRFNENALDHIVDEEEILKMDLLDVPHLTKHQFETWLRSIIIGIVTHCHKDDRESVKALRHLLWENLLNILDEIVEFVDEKFIKQLFKLLTTPVHTEQNKLNKLGHVAHSEIIDEKQNEEQKAGDTFQKVNIETKEVDGKLVIVNQDE